MKNRSLFSKIILFILIIALVLFGADKFLLNSKANTSVAEVGNTKITLQEYRESYYDELQYLQQILGRTLSDDQIKDLNIKYSILNRLIERAVLLNLVDDLNLKIGMNSIIEHTKGIKVFQDTKGNFDKEKFNNALINSGFTEQKYISNLKNSFPIMILMNSMFMADSNAYLQFDDDIVKKIYQYRHQKRVADVVTVVPEAVLKNLKKTTETELKELYDKNLYSFSTAEYRNAVYLTISPQNFSSQAVVTDEEVQSVLLNSNPYDQVDILNLIFPTKEEANKAEKAIKEGISFEQVVTDYSESKIDEILLKNITANMLPEEIRNMVFSLKEGEVSPVLQSVFGWHIIKVKSIHKISSEDLQNLTEDTRNYLIQQKNFELMGKLSEELNSKIKQGVKLEEIASSNGLILHETGVIDIKGIDDKGNLNKELPKSEEFIAFLFAQEMGQISQFTPIGDDYYSILVTNVIPSKIKSFEESKDEVLKLWQNKTATVEMEKVARSIAAGLKAGVDFGTTLTGVVIHKRQQILRNDIAYAEKIDQSCPADVVNQIFILDKGAITEPVILKGGVSIAVVHDVINTTDVSEFGFTILKKELAAANVEALRGQMLKYLLMKYNIKIHKKVMDRI